MATRVVMLLENNPYPQDTRVRNEAEALAADGLEVTVIAPRGPGQRRRERLASVEVHRFRLPWARASRRSYLLEYAVAHAQLTLAAASELARGAQVVHLHGPPDTMFIAGICARSLRRRFVFDLHDSAPELFAAKFGSGGRTLALLRSAQVAAIRVADHVIVTNGSQLDLVKQRGGVGEEHVTIVRNGARQLEFGEPPPARPGELAHPRLIYVGALDAQDGVLELSELLAEPALAGATLTVVGDGPLREQLAERCRDAGLGERVAFTGHVPHAAVPALIWEADVGLDPAPASELNHGSTMIKVLEYMGAGRPLVAYDLRETRYSAAGAALYAPSGDRAAFAAHVAALARDGRRRAQMGELARRRALELGWEQSARALTAAYGHLTNGSATTRKSAASATVGEPCQ